MNAKSRWFLYWSPRILAIFFAAFLSLFALDVFSEGYGFGETLIALVMHLVPTLIVVVALVIAWRWEWVGAVLFFGLALSYWVMAWGQFPFVNYLTISGPLLLTGLLFLFNWKYRDEFRAPPPEI